MTNPTLSLAIIIPSWNSAAQLKANLPSVIKAARAVSAPIIIVDDASTDDSLSIIKSDWGYPITFESNPTNQGYGVTINRAVALAQTDLVVVLNTDVSLLPDSLLAVGKYFADPTVFALGLNSGEGSMRVVWERGLFHHFRNDQQTLGPSGFPISLWASGGQGVFDRRKWEQLGGMNPLFAPFYWEDTDLGYSAWKRGWQILFGADCLCVHDHQKSVIANNFSREEVRSIAQRNQFLFVWKNISDPSLLFSHFLYLPLYLFRYPKSVLQALRKISLCYKARASQRPYWKVKDQDILSLWQK